MSKNYQDGNNSWAVEATSAALPDEMAAWIKTAQETPLLSIDEEKDLAQRMASGDEEAHRKMVEANLRLLITMALRQFQQGGSHGLKLADLIQVGYVGLTFAARRFNPNAGSRFRTFASMCIAARMRRKIAEVEAGLPRPEARASE